MFGRRERGSVLLLFPAALLVILVLASIAADAALAFEAQRELANAVAGAANDAAVQALANGRFYRQGAVGLNDGEAGRLATAEVAAAAGGGIRNLAVTTSVTGNTITVMASGTVNKLFAPTIPGASRVARVTARSTARAEEH